MHYVTPGGELEAPAGAPPAALPASAALPGACPAPIADLSMRFGELAFLDRFDAAAQAGYERVEFLFPYLYPVEQIAHRLCCHGLQLVRFCLPAGDWVGGERGIANQPERCAEFRYGVEEAVRYARPLGVRQLRCLPGLAQPGLAPELARLTLVNNLRHAAAALKPHGIVLLIAPQDVADAPAIIRDTGADNLFLHEQG